MPHTNVGKCMGAPENSVPLPRPLDVGDGERVGCKQLMRIKGALARQNDIAASLQRTSEEIVGRNDLAIDCDRWMVRAYFCKEHVKANGFNALRGEFIDQSGID